MKRILTILLLMTAFIQVAGAQAPRGHLTVISEDNSPFYLFINDVQYNQRPALAVRVENIMTATVRCKVVYQQPRMPIVENAFLDIADMEGYMQDITYTVSSVRRGNRAFMVYHVIPMEPIQIAARDIQVYNLNQPNRYNSWNDTRDNRFFQKDNRYRNPRPHQDYGSRHNDPDPRYNEPQVPEAPICPTLTPAEMESLLATIKKASFDANKQEIAEFALSRSCFTTDQIIAIVQTFSFDDSKLKVAKLAYSQCLDQHNYFKVVDKMTFSSSKTDLSQFIKNR